MTSVRTKLLATQLALVLGVCYFFFFFGLGAFGLTGADEPRYAQIAREMLARHDWIVPTLNGSPWLEKPALLYWKMMNSYAIFGLSDWAARIPAAFHATAVVFGIFFFMRRFRFASELDAAMIAASSAGMIGFGRGASTDMLVSAPFALAMMCWWTWHQTSKKLWLVIFYGLLGVGALAKGPVAPALAVLVVGAYAVLRRDGRIFVRSLSLIGFLLFAAIVLPWYLAVQHKVPQFFRVFFIEHNLERFGTNLYQHSQPFWYYIPVFLLAAMPWTLFAVPALIDAGRNAWKRWRAKSQSADPKSITIDADADDGLPSFLFVWIVVPIVFFSISRAKLPGYILPAIPAAALLTADYVHRLKAVPRLLTSFHALLCAMLMVGALMAPFAMMKVQPPSYMGLFMAVTGGVIAFMVLVMVRREGIRVLHFVTLVPTILAVAFLLRPAAATIDRTQSARPINQRLVELGVDANEPVASFNVKRQVAYGLDFYRNQPISHYEQEGPLDLPSGIPSGKHVVVAREGSLGAVQAAVGNRQVLPIGTFPLQHLEFFQVSAAK
ncbi:MAG TPA: glycosyltransferase family 39 protein [Candidatus Binatia bacterium]|nr:glycosyltransferase family 39 protein [Candidatus Binatia bacterium]